MSEAEIALLEYVTKVTEAAYRTTPDDVQMLRNHRWTEPQIAEAVYITAMFAFFNRVADAFGIQSPGYLEGCGMTMEAPEAAAPITTQQHVDTSERHLPVAKS